MNDLRDKDHEDIDREPARDPAWAASLKNEIKSAHDADLIELCLLVQDELVARGIDE